MKNLTYHACKLQFQFFLAGLFGLWRNRARIVRGAHDLFIIDIHVLRSSKWYRYKFIMPFDLPLRWHQRRDPQALI